MLFRIICLKGDSVEQNGILTGFLSISLLIFCLLPPFLGSKWVEKYQNVRVMSRHLQLS